MYVCAGSVSGIWRSWAQQRNIQAVQCSDGIALRCRQYIIVQQCSGIQERGRQRHSRGCSSSRRMSHLTVCTVLSVLKLSALLQCTVLSALLQCTVLSTTQAVCFVTVHCTVCFVTVHCTEYYSSCLLCYSAASALSTALFTMHWRSL